MKRDFKRFGRYTTYLHRTLKQAINVSTTHRVILGVIVGVGGLANSGGVGDSKSLKVFFPKNAKSSSIIKSEVKVKSYLEEGS